MHYNKNENIEQIKANPNNIEQIKANPNNIEEIEANPNNIERLNQQIEEKPASSNNRLTFMSKVMGLIRSGLGGLFTCERRHRDK